MQLPKKIPTIVAFLLLAVLIGVASFFIEQTVKQTAKASSSWEPKNVLPTNITDTSFTITWTTEALTTGMITFTSSQNKKMTAFDERDTLGKLGKYLTHSVSVKNIQPKTLYSFTILSNGKSFSNSSFSITTGPSLSTDLQGFDPAYGNIKTKEGNPAEGALITLTIDGGQTLSTLVRSSGSWILPLNAVRTKDLSSYIPKQEKQIETIAVIFGNQKSDVTTDTLNDSPVPEIILGNTYDFQNQAKTKTHQTLASVPTRSPTEKPSSQPSVLGDQTKNTKTPTVSITNPKDNGTLASSKPLFQGTGIPGKSITLLIGLTKTQTGKTVVGENGLWQFTPKTALPPGKQSITITTIDQKGKPQALTHSFTILKSGTQVLGDATPSADLTPEPTIEPTPDTSSISAEPMPESGSTFPTILLTLFAILSIGGGVFLFFKKEGV